MKIKKFPLVLIAILLTTVACFAQQGEPNVDRLKKDVSYLASEKLTVDVPARAGQTRLLVISPGNSRRSD